MGLEFKEKRKADQREIENITEQLFKFVTQNKNYLKITFAIMSTYTQIERNMEDRILVHPMVDDIEEDENLEEYIKIIEDFYNLNIQYRRGDLLELLSGHISPLNECEDYKIIRESLVYENGSRLGDKDIDVITEYKNCPNIECIECKANVKNYIGRPMDDECKAKLNFMKLVSDRAKAHEIKCRLLFATYRDDIDYSLDILTENGYNMFEIMRGSEIIQRLSS